jgi:hypothetical protein
MNQIHQNPLKGYFRQFKVYLKLPSGTSYYAPNTISFTDAGEIGIMPMTGKDELILKNPDALLNGEALVELIKSCVPAVSDPKLLLTNDIDAIVTAIRYATYNDSLETELSCPNCGHTNLYKLNLQYSIDNMTFLDSEYVVNLDSGLSVFVRPYGFPELLKGLHAQFEQSKLTRAIENESLSEEQRMKLFATAFKELSTVTYTLILNSVVKVVDESCGINVSNKEDIKEFLQNIDKKSSDKISDLIKEINQIGIKKSFTAVCEKCKHGWESEVDFNPVNFS